MHGEEAIYFWKIEILVEKFYYWGHCSQKKKRREFCETVTVERKRQSVVKIIIKHIFQDMLNKSYSCLESA